MFAESGAISQLAAGTPAPDVVAGICASAASRAAALAKRAGFKEQVHTLIVVVIKEALITTPPDPARPAGPDGAFLIPFSRQFPRSNCLRPSPEPCIDAAGVLY